MFGYGLVWTLLCVLSIGFVQWMAYTDWFVVFGSSRQSNTLQMWFGNRIGLIQRALPIHNVIVLDRDME